MTLVLPAAVFSVRFCASSVKFLWKTGWGKTVTLNIGKAYGPLEPGYYTVSKKLINKETGETYTVSGGFQIAE